MNVKITQDEYENIIDMYISGDKLQKIADIYSVSVGCICRILKRSGVPKRKNRNVKQSRFTKEDIYKDAELYLDRKYEIYKNRYLCNENINSSLQN